MQVRGIPRKVADAGSTPDCEPGEAARRQTACGYRRSHRQVRRLNTRPPSRRQFLLERAVSSTARAYPDRALSVVSNKGELWRQLQVRPDVDVAHQPRVTDQPRRIASRVTGQEAHFVEIVTSLGRKSLTVTVGMSPRSNQRSHHLAERTVERSATQVLAAEPRQRQTAHTTPFWRANTVSSASHSYLDETVRLLTKVRDEQSSAIHEAADLVARAVSAGGLVHLFGTGHSHLLAEELFYRAGGLAQINPILVDALMLHCRCRTKHQPRAAVGPGGSAARQRADRAGRRDDRRLELRRKRDLRRDGAGRAQPRDVNDRGHEHSACDGTRGSTEVEDADCTKSSTWSWTTRANPATRAWRSTVYQQRIGPTSTVVGAAMLNAVVAESAELMIARGHTPDVFASSNMAQVTTRSTRRLITRYAPRVRAL